MTLRNWFEKTGTAMALIVCAAACKDKPPVPGDTCTPTDIRCVDAKTELACQKGVFIATPCKGPSGCRESNKQLFCDVTGNVTGDLCSTDEEGSASCIGKDRRITCRGGKEFVDECRGDDGCRSAGAVRCDQSKGEEGDPCTGQTNACSTDGKRVLTCHDGRLVTTAQCPGEDGCTIVERKVSCDLGKKASDKRSAP
ncbi:MAG TPA: hypothetical protein VH142_23425 [Polyangiaceae bacterium]|jgi:hypothetical protein|nr:hypothetical protein [Polyangiaceae bacterium]